MCIINLQQIKQNRLILEKISISASEVARKCDETRFEVDIYSCMHKKEKREVLKTLFRYSFVSNIDVNLHIYVSSNILL